MSPQQLTAAPAGTGGTAAPIPSAAQLAARIQIPRRLPPRYDGQPLQHLSHSSYNRFVLCPEDWRRRYMLGEKTAPTGVDVPRPPGRRRDHALLPAHPRPRRAPLRSTRSRTRSGTAGKPPPRPSASSSGSPGRPTCARTARSSSASTRSSSPSAELIPHLGEPVAVQRKVEYTLAPGLEWSVLCYLDLETRRPDAGALLPAVVDYKVKTTPLTQYKADHDFQPAVYLAGRWLEGDPAAQFCFAQIAKPGPRRKEIGASLVTTSQIDRPAARRARPDRASRSADRRLLRAVRPRRALGIRRPERLEVQRALLRGVGKLPRRGGRVSPEPDDRGPPGSAVRRAIPGVGRRPRVPVRCRARTTTDRSSDATVKPATPATAVAAGQPPTRSSPPARSRSAVSGGREEVLVLVEHERGIMRAFDEHLGAVSAGGRARSRTSTTPSRGPRSPAGRPGRPWSGSS